MKTWLRRGVVLVLFTALVVVLLWFQGLVLRDRPQASQVPGPPALAADARTATVELRTLPETRVYPGFVEAEDPADLAPRVMAAVLEVRGREGDPVSAGDVLVRLDDRDARARLEQAEAALEAASAEELRARLGFERADRLLAAEAATQADWEAARAARDAAEAARARAEKAVAEARTALSWFQLTAPFDGRILYRQAEPGQLAVPGRPLIGVFREERLRFRVAVPEELASTPALAIGNELELEFDGRPTARGRVARVLPPSDPATGTVTVHLALAADTGLRPGQLGRLRLEVGRREALMVPAAAIQRIGQIERARLVRDGRVVLVALRTGKAHGDDVEVLSGLAAGERVVLP